MTLETLTTNAINACKTERVVYVETINLDTRLVMDEKHIQEEGNFAVVRNGV